MANEATTARRFWTGGSVDAATDELPVLLNDGEHADDGRVVLARKAIDEGQAGVDPAMRPDDDFAAFGGILWQLMLVIA